MTRNAEQIFNEALQQSAGELRSAFLDGACGGDADLRSRVEALLRAHEGAGSFLESRATMDPSSEGLPFAQTVSSVPSQASPHEAPGTRIGPYKLLQMIGEGGFGTVFMAEQQEPVRRRVALKIIKLGMDTRQVIARFEAERQALALMDHPNIARVLDAGATATGRPYFVMDLVKGEPIAEYCDKQNLSIESRLQLFAQVCNAVQHAHTKGVIHRDIKPSNVLVATQDGQPQAKVIDFGIAKATANKLTEKTLFTEHKQLIGTPEYMSPEQAEGSLDIDTRTDVYSLGVLLYELLTGVTPFDAKSLRSAAYAEIQRIIREVDPPNPSTRLSQNTDTIASVAARRQVEPRKLGSIVRGELDWIVMKALEKDRQRRYETANGLAADIQRFLSGEAVVAAPPSATYRLQKFVRRNKGIVLSSGAVAAALLIGVIGFAWQARIAQRERDLARIDRNRAVAAESETRKRADELKQVSEFQASMLSEIDSTDAGVELMKDLRAKYAAAVKLSNIPEAERPARLEAFAGELARVNATDTAADMIDRTIFKRAITAVDVKFQDQPAVDAALRHSLAELYRTLGRFDAAFPLQERALALRRKTLGSDHPETLASVWNMARVLHSQGKLIDAEPFAREAMEKRRSVLGNNHVDTLMTINLMAELLQDQGKLAEAEPLAREAMETARRVLGADHHETVNYISSMGLLLDARGKRSDAEPLIREAMERSRRVNGEDHPDTLNSLNNYGYLLVSMGKPAEAEKYLREMLEKQRRVRGEDHPYTLLATNNVARVLEDQDKMAEAEAMYRDVTLRYRRVLGDDHPGTLRAITNLGNILRSQNKLAEAEPLVREAMESRRRVLGDDHRETLISINVYGYLLVVQGKVAEGERYWREAYERGLRALGEDHPDVLVWGNNLGGLLRSQGKLTEAEPYLREALAKSRRINGEDHPGTLTMMKSLADLLQRQDKFSEAEPMLREVFEKRRRVLGEEHTDTAFSASELGWALRKLGKLPEAETQLRDAVTRFNRLKGADSPSTAIARLGLGNVLSDLKRYPDAEAELLSAEKIFSASPAAAPTRHQQCIESLHKLYEDWNKISSGQGYDAKAAEWRAKLEQLKPPTTAPRASG